MQSHDAEFTVRNWESKLDGENHARLVNTIADILQKRDTWRDQLLSRSRAVERDIDSWVAQSIAEAFHNPWIDPPSGPPRSMFDVEPPF